MPPPNPKKSAQAGLARLRSASCGWQLVASIAVGAAGALCVEAIYAAVVGGIAGDYMAGDAGLWVPVCVMPVMLCFGSFVCGRLLRRITDEDQSAIKSLLATPAFYDGAYFLISAGFAAHSESLSGYGGGFWHMWKVIVEGWYPVLIASCVIGWPLTYLGFRTGRPSIAPGTWPRCEKCGYNLTGNLSGICPECGTPIPEETTETTKRTADDRTTQREVPRSDAQ